MLAHRLSFLRLRPGTQRRIARAAPRRPGAAKLQARFNRPTSSDSQGDRAHPPSGPHSSPSTFGKPLSAISILGLSKIFSNTPDMIFEKTPDVCPARARPSGTLFSCTASVTSERECPRPEALQSGGDDSRQSCAGCAATGPGAKYRRASAGHQRRSAARNRDARVSHRQRSRSCSPSTALRIHSGRAC